MKADKHKVTPAKCPICMKKVDAASAMNGPTEPPKKGDISLCLNCAALAQYDENGQLVSISADQALQVLGVQQYLKLLQGQEWINNKNKRN